MRLRWMISASVLGGLAAACWRGAPAAPSPAPRPAAATDGVRDALRDGFAQRLPGRVFVEKYGRGSITASGPPLGGDRLHRSPAEYAVVDPGLSPRIVAEERGIRFVLYVDPGDLRQVATREVALLPTPATRGPHDAGAGAELLPGAAIRVLSRQGAWAEVMLEDPALEARGWVPGDALGVVYAPVQAPPPALNAGLRAGAAVLDRPRGIAIARVTRELRAAAGPVRDGFVPVTIERPATDRRAELALRARGFVAVADLDADADELIEEGGETVELRGSAHQRSLDEGVRLHATIGGEVIGITLPDARASEGSRSGPWRELVFDTAWGELRVWARI
ncbi:MAG TPA: hypothetical protein VHT91_18700 [Kofleriaceae bacterium]|jgi:hypothetical protein|nr:hypothetical protein [Kofleriaceae bacterium]